MSQFRRCALGYFKFFLLIYLSQAQPIDDSHGNAGDALSERQWVSRGINVVTDSAGECTPDQVITLRAAILDASYLAGAALNAAANFTDLPFRYFFESDLQTANTVAGVYRRIQRSQQGRGNLIFVACVDIYNVCETGAIVRPGYAALRDNDTPVIVICPSGLALSRNPVPCTQNPGSISLGWLLLHEMTHVSFISGPGLKVIDTEAETARDIQDDLDDGHNTTLDANAYAYLGTYAWDLGLGGPPWNQQKTCLENFSKGQFDLEGAAVINAALGRGG